MKITSLELVGFKRMMLNAVERFFYTPTEPIQLILGTNGSGKSSLIGELTPLPPNPADYTKEGSKTITILHRGHTYVLKSWFSPSQKHSFMRDDEERNPGGTVTVQKELVWQEFGVDGEIHELLTGLQNFTSMSPSRRREWFTRLSDVSYDYALEVFGRLKERTRDISGALKLAKKRLVAESEKLISPEEQTKLEGEVKALLDELDLLQSNRAPVERPISSYEAQLREGTEELYRMSNRLLRIKLVAPYGTNPRRMPMRDDWGYIQTPVFMSLGDIDTYLNELRHDISVKEALINKSVTEHSKIKETVDVLIKTGEEGIKALLEKQNALRALKKDILAKRKLGIEGCDASNAASALDSVTELLVAIFSEIPANEEKRYSQTRLQELQAQLQMGRDQRVRTIQQLTQANSQKQHMDAHKANGATTCPKCSHTWIAGYSDEKYTELSMRIAQLELAVESADKALKALEAEIAEIEAYAVQYRDYVRCTRSWPVLAPFWEYLTEGNYVSRSPRAILSLIEVFKEDLRFELEARDVDRQLQEQQQLIASAEKVGDANLTETKSKLDEVTLVIENLTYELNQLRKKHSDYSHYRRQLAEATDLGARISQLRDQLTSMNTEMVEMIRRDTLNHCIRQLQHSLARKEETLNSVKLQKELIADLERQIQQYTVQEEAAKQLARQLSPTDGLIAEGLLGFIRSFTGQMNGIIKKIWSYPLFIKDCGVSGEIGAELDYKFPLVVQTKSNEVSDVSKGSSGMQEVVNLAFKMVAMKYLGLAESPLYLDEFGKTFDEAHRSTATEVTKSVMTQQPFTQLFMVSHYESSYGALTNAEICVICPNNITIPAAAKYNNHVVIQ